MNEHLPHSNRRGGFASRISSIINFFDIPSDPDIIERQLEERLVTQGISGFILVPTAEAMGSMPVPPATQRPLPGSPDQF